MANATNVLASGIEITGSIRFSNDMIIDGKIDELPGERASIKDWADHTTTLFPEVRLKTYLEMRGADAGPWSSLCEASGMTRLLKAET